MSRPDRRGRVLQALAPLLVSAIITVPVGCSSLSRYKVADFLFDGVQHPDSLRAQAQRDSLRKAQAAIEAVSQTPDLVAGTTRTTIVKHSPYEDGDCTVCHESGDRRSFSGTAALVDPVRVLCRDCHDDMEYEELRQEYKWVHGPVAAGACTGCHNPHQSTFDKLLLADGSKDLCLRCHQEKAIVESPSHADPIKNACTDCHGPHGWSSRGGRELPATPESDLDRKGE